MPYTLMKALTWLLVALVLGIVVGWLLRNATARRQVARARGERGDAAELEHLRARSTQLDVVAGERDRLAAELEACRNERDRLAAASGPPPTRPPVGDASAPVGAAADEPAAAASPDLDAAAAVLGHPVELDDLTEIEGIGEKVEELCHGIGIRTWGDLAAIEVSLLRTMLSEAGARYKVHDPTTWPEQAALLADGNWDGFKAYTDRLRGGTDSS